MYINPYNTTQKITTEVLKNAIEVPRRILSI